MGGRSSDSDAEKNRKNKKSSRSKRSRSRSSSVSSSSVSSSDRRHHLSSKHNSRGRTMNKSKSSPDTSRRGSRKYRSRSRSRERKDSFRSSYSRQDRRSHKKSRSPSRERSSKSNDTEFIKKSKSGMLSNIGLKTLSGNSKNNEDQIKLKMQMALKAAADADAQLRQQGLLTPKINSKDWGRNTEQDEKPTKSELNKWTREPTLTVREQIDRARAVDEINAPGFQPQSFLTGVPTSSQSKESETISDSHDSAMFGVSDFNLIAPPKPLPTTVTKNVCVAHENLFANLENKEEKWIRKLISMRQRKLNGEAMS